MGRPSMLVLGVRVLHRLLGRRMLHEKPVKSMLDVLALRMVHVLDALVLDVMRGVGVCRAGHSERGSESTGHSK